MKGLARVHDLSTYTPICRSCGLIICAVNLPQYCCPDCLNPLVTGSFRDALIVQLESELTWTIAKEIEENVHMAEEARRLAGEFPSLPPSSSSAGLFPTTQKANVISAKPTHKVMSLTGGSHRVVVSSYMNRPPANCTTEIEDSEPERVRPPPPPPVTKRKPNPDRPFENFIHGSVTYKPRNITYPTLRSSRRKEKNEREQENS